MDMRTDWTAAPHAGLGYQFLRVQVRKLEKETEVHPVEVQQVSGGQQLQKHRSSGRQGDDVRAEKAKFITAALALY